MLYKIVSLNKTQSYGTIAMFFLKSDILNLLISCPSIKICPEVTS